VGGQTKLNGPQQQTLTVVVPFGGMRMDIRPLHDRVVVKRIEETENMRGSLYIPDSAKEKPQEGEVVAVGKGKRSDDGKLIALDVQVGDRILFGKYSGSDIKIDGNEYLIMREDEILGVLENVAV
jgi:chaperonin GroES